MKLMTGIFLILVSMNARAQNFRANSGEWMKVNDARSVICHWYPDFINVWGFRVSVNVPHHITSTGVLERGGQIVVFDAVFSDLSRSVNISRSESFQRKCDAAKIQALQNNSAVYINIYTGEVLPEDGFFHHGQ